MEYIDPAFRLEFREFCVSLYLRQIDDIFTASGLQPGTVPQNSNVSGDRRYRVQEYYEAIDWSSIEDSKKFLKVIGLVLAQSYLGADGKKLIKELCERYGLVVNGIEVSLSNGSEEQASLFKKQFPAGLPFGKQKPNFSITAEVNGQSLQYEIQSGLGLINDDVYPDFTFTVFQNNLGIEAAANLALKKSLITMNQTGQEKRFLQAYAKLFNMANAHVPLLIPQAWIQWHSANKRHLREIGASHADELYRVDFVAFWKNKRHAVLIDDIGHYGRKSGEKWLADEERYSQRLKEDRRLQNQGWKVFRVSNWEIKNDETLKEILLDFGEYLGVEPSYGQQKNPADPFVARAPHGRLILSVGRQTIWRLSGENCDVGTRCCDRENCPLERHQQPACC